MTELQIPEFRGDCENCVGLCCMAFAFDASDLFAYDKPAGEPCRHMIGDSGCKIHDQRLAKGFGGCLRYDCLGAGQRVSQTVFPGQSWRDSPKTSRQFQDAFRAMREVHRLLELVLAAGNLRLDPVRQVQHQSLVTALIPDEDWSAASLAEFENGPVPGQVQEFLTSLATLIGDPAPGTLRQNG